MSRGPITDDSASVASLRPVPDTVHKADTIVAFCIPLSDVLEHCVYATRHSVPWPTLFAIIGGDHV